MYRYGLYICIIIIITGPFCFAGLTFETEEPEEVFLSFRYRQVVSTYITGLYHKGDVFLPIGELFYTLQINHSFDYQAGTVIGFYLTEDKTYKLDFERGIAQLGRTVEKIDSTQFIQTGYETYVLPALLEEIFELRFSVHLGTLSLNLFTHYTLPVVERYQRRLRNRYAESITALQPHAPLKYDRNRSWLNGGVFDYRLSTVQSNDGNQQYSYVFNSGIELAGGDLQVSTIGGYSSNVDHRNTTRYRWRYALRENQYLTQISVGEVFTDGISRASIHGLQLTNMQIEPRRVLATYAYSARTEPEWEVELYINGRLYDITTADETGQYNFDIPLMYGSSRLEVKKFGPGGGYQSVNKRIEIPYTMFSPGEIYYTVNAGNTFYTDRTVAQARTYAGLAKWITVSAGLEYHADIYGERPVGFSSVTLRPSMRYLVDLEIAPSLYYRSIFNILTGMRSRIGIGFTEYAGSFNRFNRSGMQRELDVQTFFPFRVRSQEFSVRLRAGYQDFDTRYNVRTSLNVSTSIARIVFTGGVHTSHRSSGLTQRTDTDIAAGMVYRFRGNHLLRNTTLRSRMYYNTFVNRFDNVTVALSRPIGRVGRVEGRYVWDGRFGGHSFSLRLNFDFPSFRSTSNAWHRNQRATFSQQVTGSIAYDSGNGDIVFSNTSQSGTGMASIRFFIDDDGSGSYDEGETVVAEVPVRFRGAVRSERNGDGISRVYRLRPYNRYSVDIDEDKIPNPMIAPLYKSFSFIADPNSFKWIDVPLQVTGEISGEVIRASSSGDNGVNGVRLIIRNTENGKEYTVRTFSDGTYYKMGLPPATYNVSIDSTQIKGTDLIPDPEMHIVTIEESRYGDYVYDVNFILRSRARATDDKPIIVTGSDSVSEEKEVEEKYEEYVVRINPYESLWSISESFYGTPDLWPKIWSANYENIPHPDRIYPGQGLSIPPKAPLTDDELKLRERYYLHSQ